MPNSPRLRYAHRDQGQIRCESLEELLPPDHPVRAVLAFVEGLDLTPLLDGIGALPGAPGAPAFDPRILMSLWLYATLQGIGSSRDLEDQCTHHLAYRWLCGDLSLSYRTLSGFRTRRGETSNRLLAQTAAALMHQGLVTLHRVAQDGMRVRAAAGASSFHRSATLERC